MQFSLLNLMLLVSPILAFTIPEGQAEGVYQVSYVDGKEIHTFVRENDLNDSTTSPELSQPANSAKFRHAKRDGYACGGDALNHGDTDYANANIDAQCGNGNWIGAGLDFYSIKGCTVAYACNFGSLAQPCEAYRRQQVSQGITNQCGWYNSGWYVAGQGEVSYGYENFCKWPGSNFCSRGTG